MAFDPAHITYPIGNLQHMFNRHKEDWGFKDVNWNKVTQEEFKAALVQFIGETDTVCLRAMYVILRILPMLLRFTLVPTANRVRG